MPVEDVVLYVDRMIRIFLFVVMKHDVDKGLYKVVSSHVCCNDACKWQMFHHGERQRPNFVQKMLVADSGLVPNLLFQRGLIDLPPPQ